MSPKDNTIKGIKSWSVDDRPREKMLANGRQSLSDSELLAIILGSGSVGESALDLAKRILQDHQNNLNELGKILIKDLVKRYKGVGEAKAINIVACLELGRRRRDVSALEKPIVTSSGEAFDIFYQYLADHEHEEFWIMMLNRGCRFIKVEKIGVGNLNSVIADVRTIIKLALDHQASSIILCHNHPSGTLKPSNPDINITKKVMSAASLFDIVVQDHIIIGDNSYYSFNDNGQM